VTDAEKPRQEPSEDEPGRKAPGELPDREALSLLDANVAIPADPAIAADVLAGEDPAEADEPSDDGVREED
jgi:hypothetical protein